MSALDLVLSRLHGVVRKKGLTLARCPAHADASPSLSVREAADGQVLVHCFAGCTFPEIAAALELRETDFFPPRDPAGEEYQILKRAALRRRYRVAHPALQARMLEEQLASAEARVRARLIDPRGNFGPCSPLRAEHRNEAREEVAETLGIVLPPLSPFAWEGAPHDSDPLWPLLFERGLHWAQREAEGLIVREESIRFRAASLAAGWLHEIAS